MPGFKVGDVVIAHRPPVRGFDGDASDDVEGGTIDFVFETGGEPMYRVVFSGGTDETFRERDLERYFPAD